MSRIGSEEWVAALDAALGALPGASGPDAADVPAGAPDMVVQQEVSDTGAAWYIVIVGGVAHARIGHHADPDVTLAQDEATAVAINEGTLSAQTAFIDGRLRVRGAVGQLTEVAGVLGALAAVPATAGS